MTVIEVGAPDEDRLYAEAASWSNPDHGLLTLVVPPIVDRASGILGPLLEAAGATALRRSAANEAQAVENAVVRLRAHGIHTVVLLQAGWIPLPVQRSLVSAAALAGITLIAIGHPANGDGGVIGAWRSSRWGWAELRGWVSRHSEAWHLEAEQPRRHQRHALPPLGLAGPLVLPPLAPASPPETRAYAGARLRLHGGPPVGLAATVVRHALREAKPADRADAVRGIAAALAEVGYELHEAQPTGTPLTWRDVRRVPETAAAAAIVLASVGLDERTCARLASRDVGRDGSTIQVGGRTVAVPAAAQPYLLAHRLLRPRDTSPFLVVQNQPLGPAGVRNLLIEGLRWLGLTLDPRACDHSISPSQRWLLGHGLLIVRTSGADVPRDVTEPGDGSVRRCRHGLPGWIEIPGGGLTHSQRLCRARELEEARPAAAGFVVAEIEVADGVARYAVSSPRGAGGNLWRVETPLGVAWVNNVLHDADGSSIRDRVLTAQRVGA